MRGDTGVARYVFATATVKVGFPVDFRGSIDLCCVQCPYYQRNYRMCALNKKLCAYPEHYVGADCPLEIQESEETNHEKG